MPDLQTLYQLFNEKYFAGKLPACEIVWSRRLTRVAGKIHVSKRLIKLSVPILHDAFSPEQNSDAEYVVCGVLCRTREAAIEEILKHEMIHLWLFENGLPCGHTREFRAKAREMGQTEIRHQIAVPPAYLRWKYFCSVCGASFTRVRRFSADVACRRCCKKFNGGKFHHRFKLHQTRIVPVKVSES